MLAAFFFTLAEHTLPKTFIILEQYSHFRIFLFCKFPMTMHKNVSVSIKDTHEWQGVTNKAEPIKRQQVNPGSNHRAAIQEL
jgi:hypothetical protein